MNNVKIIDTPYIMLLKIVEESQKSTQGLNEIKNRLEEIKEKIDKDEKFKKYLITLIENKRNAEDFFIYLIISLDVKQNKYLDLILKNQINEKKKSRNRFVIHTVISAVVTVFCSLAIHYLTSIYFGEQLDKLKNENLTLIDNIEFFTGENITLNNNIDRLTEENENLKDNIDRLDVLLSTLNLPTQISNDQHAQQQNNQPNIGVGPSIGANAIIGDNITFGNNVIIRASATVGSDVTIGNDVEIGAAATVRRGVTIGNNVKIGAVATITRDIPDNTTVSAGVTW